MSLFSLNLYLFSLVVSFSCHQKPKKPVIEAVEIFSRYPMVTPDGKKVDNFDIDYKIYYYGDLRMYKYYYYNDSLKKDGDFIRRKAICHFVFHKDSLYGLNHDPYNPLKEVKRLRVDSLLANVKLGTFGLERFVTSKPDSVIIDKEGVRKEVFYTKGTKEDPGDYITYLYFSAKMNGIKESFWPALDSSRKMKYFKNYVISYSYYDIKYKMNFPRREGYYERKRVQIDNEKELLRYFNGYLEKSRVLLR